MKTVVHLTNSRELLPHHELNRKLYLLEKKVDELMFTNQVLVINTMGDIHFVKQDEIIYVRVDSNYAMVRLVDGRKILASKTLKLIQNKLSGKHFIRVCNSFLVNKKHINHCIGGSKKVVCLTGEIEILVSRNHFENILQAFSI